LTYYIGRQDMMAVCRLIGLDMMAIPRFTRRLADGLFISQSVRCSNILSIRQWVSIHFQ